MVWYFLSLACFTAFTGYLIRVVLLMEAFTDEKNDKASRVDAWVCYRRCFGPCFPDYRERVLDKLAD